MAEILEAVKAVFQGLGILLFILAITEVMLGK